MKPGTTDLDRERLRAALLAIVESNNGVLNPRHVVELARDPEHVVHPYLEWDDARGGEEYRVLQVGALVRQVRLTIVRANPATREISITTARAYQSRPTMRGSRGGYEPVDAILADAEKRHELLTQVLRELASYRKRYAELAELEPVWLAVDEAAADLRPVPLSPSAPDGEVRHGAAG